MRPGTIGRTLGGFHTRFGDDGEIRMRGRNVMMGYKGMPEKTAETFDEDGWLRSGDVGREDGDGFVSITGRIKEILITAGGENVAPVPIENSIKKFLPCVGHAVLVGDKR